MSSTSPLPTPYSTLPSLLTPCHLPCCGGIQCEHVCITIPFSCHPSLYLWSGINIISGISLSNHNVHLVAVLAEDLVPFPSSPCLTTMYTLLQSLQRTCYHFLLLFWGLHAWRSSWWAKRCIEVRIRSEESFVGVLDCPKKSSVYHCTWLQGFQPWMHIYTSIETNGVTHICYSAIRTVRRTWLSSIADLTGTFCVNHVNHKPRP